MQKLFNNDEIIEISKAAAEISNVHAYSKCHRKVADVY